MKSSNHTIIIMQKYTLQNKQKFDTIFGNKPKPSQVENEFYEKTFKYTRCIKWIPGIRMVGIGNSISMNSATKDSDIDLLIVTDKNRMWLVRIFCTFIFQTLNVRKTGKKHAGRFCLSFFCTLDGLNFSSFVLDKDPYLYFWVLYFKPILDYNDSYNLFLEKNASWANFDEFSNILDNNKKYIQYSKTQVSTEGFSPLNKLLNTILKTIDTLLKKLFLPKTLKQYESLGKPFGIIINDDMLKFHNGDIRKEIAQKFK